MEENIVDDEASEVDQDLLEEICLTLQLGRWKFSVHTLTTMNPRTIRLKMRFVAEHVLVKKRQPFEAGVTGIKAIFA